ncbi:MAG TPA: uroporphyrinogen-III C-methyltransferase [Aromatoleum sp.]|uniref:uroporphyrinogen-III C-methyltransferase n=1 Tax=Aromatoleum sp. TaxID=2307007 RepID=UPI002B475104|nr:uroporphyrinogen-III C-methyltransferase [Aromatoleum sp.]HJV27091.1 uroporphyrinogen-III C-methyltransferase [Aromatoleum sp.]
MNEEQSALTQPPAAEASAAFSRETSGAATSGNPPPRAAGGSSWPGLLAGVAFVAVGVVGWQVYELRSGVAQVRTEVAQRITSSEAAAGEARTLLRQQQDSLASLQGKIGALEAQVAATEGQAAALQTLYQEFSRNREDRAIAEAEQAVSVAAQQLQLAGNADAALIALQGAESRLAAQDRGQLLPLRRALMHDIDRLKATPQVDVQGIALRLEGLLEAVDSLPLAFAGELAPNAPAAGSAPAAGDVPALEFVKALARDIWHELAALVRVERLDQSEPELLAPAQSTFLRENLKIRLLTARLALLARDGRTFAADLAQAEGWISRFFDQRDEKVQKALAALTELKTTQVRVDQPGPTESIAALRMLQARGAESGGKPTPDASSPARPAPAGKGAEPARPAANGGAH